MNLWKDCERFKVIESVELRGGYVPLRFPRSCKLVRITVRNQSRKEMVAIQLTVSTIISDNIKHRHMIEAKGNSPRRHGSREVAARGTTAQVC